MTTHRNTPLSKHLIQRPAKADLVELIHQTADAAPIEIKVLADKIANLLHPDGSSESSYLKNTMSINQPTLPSLAYLLAVYLVTHGNGDLSKIPKSPEEREKWLVFWLAGQIESLIEKKENPLPLEYRKQWLDTVSQMKERYRHTDIRVAGSGSYLPTLQHFPSAFLPLVVITGASQTYPPRQREDLFRDNAQFSDLTYLPRFDFGSKPLLISDRAIISMQNDEERAALLGDKNLLIIGGPAVNVVTREYWKQSIFNFQFDPRRQDLTDLFDKILQPADLFSTEGFVSLFYDYMNGSHKIDIHDKPFRDRGQKPKEREKLFEIVQALRRKIRVKDAKYDQIASIYKPIGFLDPIRLDRGGPPVGEIDYALISLAPNLWERPKTTQNKRVAVIVAGFQELGTILGLKALTRASSGWFDTHPLGGWMEVAKGDYGSKAKAFRKIGYYAWKPKHLTPGYTVAKALELIGEQGRFSAKDRSPVFEQFTEADMNAYVSFIHRFAE